MISLAAGIAIPASLKHLLGDTTTPPWPSHAGAMVTMTMSMFGRYCGESKELITWPPPSTMTLLSPFSLSFTSRRFQSR